MLLIIGRLMSSPPVWLNFPNYQVSLRARPHHQPHQQHQQHQHDQPHQLFLSSDEESLQGVSIVKGNNLFWAPSVVEELDRCEGRISSTTLKHQYSTSSTSLTTSTISASSTTSTSSTCLIIRLEGVVEALEGGECRIFFFYLV